jgi:hypothetical protein
MSEVALCFLIFSQFCIKKASFHPYFGYFKAYFDGLKPLLLTC